ncbi:pyrroline-5-carboxylate reductase [Actinomyces sp. zg296]|uniref:pyrroline-5-carboxylate reductase n=1 Tax=Actinomyces sp. zg296 TaxID=2609289 RepID=UPI001359F3EE|nr:pyrroline-5-carboxylate reductase [Actinomyces sp. zg296]
MTTYGFIGAGNMAGAIVRGAISAGIAPASLLVTSAHGSAKALAEDTGAGHVPDSAALTRRLGAEDVLVLAVKPQVLPGVVEGIAPVLAERSPLVLSIAAGLTLSRLTALLPDGARVVRAMPNMAAGVGASMTALAAGPGVDETAMAPVRALMGAVGRTVELEDKDFSAFVGLAGSSPAFVLTLIEALSRAGVLGGIPKSTAVEIVTQAVLGSALAAQAGSAAEPPRTPADLIDAICSPGGTTIAGLTAMERAGFSDAVVRAFEATVARDRELGA